MNDSNTVRSHPLIAFIVVVWSAGWWRYFNQVEPGDALASSMAAGLALAGLYVASLLFRGSPKAFKTYSWWALVDIVGLIVADTQVEPVVWKLVLGGLLAMTIPILILLYLKGEERRQLEA
ncbi:MAG: hypothetical protein ACI8X5_001368 [Planctomycetota bacterium]|jgi:hypothetical protein